MKASTKSLALIAACVLMVSTPLLAQKQQPPPRAVDYDGKAHKLVYTPEADGDRVPDYSFAGYKSGQPIPDATIVVVVKPIAGDNTDHIQAALDYAARQTRDKSIAYAVLLTEGKFEIAGQLKLNTSWVVLRGSGIEKTTLVATGQDRRPLIRIGGVDDRKFDQAVAIADAYVPLNATKLKVAKPDAFKAGQTVQITRACTAEWVHALGMDSLGGDRHGGGWKPGTREVVWDRTITAVDGDTIKLDVPLTASIDAKFGGGTVAAYTWPNRVENVGVENLICVSEVKSDNPKDEDHAWFAVAIDDARDAFVRQVDAKQFCASAVHVFAGGSRVTVEDCRYLDPISEIAGLRRESFFTEGQQTLFTRCYAQSGRHDFSTGYLAAGPSAFVQCFADGALEDSGPIDSWATGILYDNVRIDGNKLTLTDRRWDLQQAGWGAANCLLWQCTAAYIDVESPPTVTNWAYGCCGDFTGNGAYAASRESVDPDSLYYGQLAERLNLNHDEMMKRADLAFILADASSSPNAEVANRLAQEAMKPQPDLKSWIASAGKRHPINIDPGKVQSIDAIPKAMQAKPTPPARIDTPLTLTNGWLTVDGQLVTGNVGGITWWAGGVRPDDFTKLGAPAIARFVPGRDGHGLTDDLDQLTDELKSRHSAGLEQHPPLWYDVRDADHERMRRMDGDVFPPFYEMPVARSGKELAWDGLSKYDLTKPNPWYWNRLRTFANLSRDKGLVLFNNNYFQHNILEAGAHYASYCWRPVNNINDTGFPEPPNYAGDKRNFMAEQFYDETQPTRRALHEKWIRMNLEQLADQSNVIQLTSYEFTGPLHFTQFWIDTCAAWEKETGKHPLIGLAAPKDVQDGILADAARAKTVDVIAFEYWWYQNDGTPYAPPGGQNLAPRQWTRVIKVKPSTAEQTYRAVKEYRTKFPDKAVVTLVDGAERFGWPVLMGGGSIPGFNFKLDPELSKAIVTMKPIDLGQNAPWALSDGKSQWLLYSNGGAIRAKLGDIKSVHYSWVNTRDGTVGVVKDAELKDGTIDLKAPANEACVWIRGEN